jgi:lysophospholipase L1-like esterase
VLAALVLVPAAFAQSSPPVAVPATARRFYFGRGDAPPGFVSVAPETSYSRERGHGFETPVRPISVTSASLCSARPFLFSVAVPEGNYDLTFTLGGGDRDSLITVKGEARRLLLESIPVAAGRLETRKITVNVRVPEIAGGGRVELKPRESDSFTWDDKLTLEINGTRPCLSSLEIVPAVDAITVYLAGDSTVVDQADEPWAAWGQMLPRFFGPGVAVANHAESGESLKSFIRERRLDKILSTIRSGDYLFIQFAHNDQKVGPNYGKTHVDAGATYPAYLKVFIEEARARGAIPVLVTSMHRRSFTADGVINNTLLDYPEAMRQVARAENVPLVDLNAMSKVLYETLGPEKSLRAFVHYPANTFPGQAAELKDDTHFNAYGAYELARCVVEGIRTNRLGISTILVAGSPFDPAHPDPVDNFNLPASPFRSSEAPLEKR